MDAVVSNRNRSTLTAIVREHAGRIVIAFMLVAIAAGTLFHLALFNYFDQSLFSFWGIQDMLLAPLRWPGAMLLSSIVVTIGLALACRRAKARAGGLSGSLPAEGMLENSRRSFFASIGLLLGMTAFVLLIYALAYHEAAKIWYRAGNDVRIELSNNDGYINGREIAASSEFRFLLADVSGFSNRGDRKFVAIAAGEVMAITRCARSHELSSQKLSESACIEADRYSRTTRDAEAERPETSAEVIAPVQEQRPEPYQRNRLIKEPDF